MAFLAVRCHYTDANDGPSGIKVFLQKTFICKTVVPFLTHYNMVQQPQVKVTGSFLYFAGKFLVCPTGMKIAGGVIVA